MSGLQPTIGIGPIGTPQGLAEAIADVRRRLNDLEARQTVISSQSITANLIVNGSITSTQIADGSITATDIASQTITAGQIAANTITAGQIAAGTITAQQIAAGTITGALIQAGTLTANLIQAGTITAQQIAAGTITATEIATGTLTSATIAANTITAANIAAGTITTTQLAAHTITASNIAAGTITATELGVSQLSAITTNMGNITAGTITGGIIQTSATGARVVMDSGGLRGYGLDGVTKVFDINAGSGIASFTGTATLSASSVIPGATVTGTLPPATIPAIGGGNVIKDSSFETATLSLNWAVAQGGTGGTIATSTAQKRYGNNSLLLTKGTNYTFVRQSNIAINGTEPVVLSAWVYAPVATTVRLVYRPNAGTTYISGPATAISATTWTRLVFATAATSTTATLAQFDVGFETTDGATGHQIYVDGTQLESGAVATSYAPRVNELLEGSVLGINIGTGAVGATQIATGAVGATQLGTGAVTSTKIGFNFGSGNLLIDSSFAKTGLPDWDVTSAGATPPLVATTNTQSRPGTSVTSAMLTAQVVADISIRNWTTGKRIPIEANTSYTASAYFKAGSVARGCAVALDFYDNTGTRITTGGFPLYSSAANNSTTGWIRRTVTATAPSNATSCAVICQVFAPAVGEVHYVDDAQLEQGDLPSAYAPKVGEILPGTITGTMITNGTITNTQIGDLAASKITGTLADTQIAALAASKITGQLSDTQLAAISAAKITGQLSDTQLAAIAASKITGALTSAQINDLAAAKITGQLSDTQLAAISAAKITGQITPAQINMSIGGANLLNNSGAEQGTVTPWVTNGGTTAIAASPTRHGSGSFQITSNTTSGAALYRGASAGFVRPAVVVGVNYTGSAYVYAATTSRQAYVTLRFYNASNTQVGSDINGTVVSTVVGGWVRITATGTAPAGSATCDVIVRGASVQAVGEVHYVDSVQLEEGDVATAYAPAPSEINPGSITDSMLATGISGSKITAGTITNTQIGDLAASKITGTLADTQIAALAASKITGTLTNAQIADLAATKITGQLSDTQLAAIAASKITGQLSDTQLAAIAASKITGQLSDTQLAAIAAAKITGTITDSQIATGVSGTKITDGTITNSKIGDLAAAKVTGQLSDTQISALSAAKLTGQVADAQLAGISSAKLIGTLTASQIASITAAQITGQITAAQFGGTVGGNNLLQNSSFEAVTNTGAANPGYLWAVDTSGAVSVYTANPKYGPSALAWTSPATGSFTYGGIRQVTPNGSIDPNKPYTLSFWVNSAAVARTCTIYLQWQDNTGATISTPSTSITTTVGTWKRIVLTGTSPASADRVNVFCRFFTSAFNEAHYVDGAMLEEGDVATAFHPKADEILPNSVVSASLIDGAVTDAKITGLSASKVTGQLTDSQLAAISAAKLTGQITGTQITDGSITTTKLAANSVTANELAAGSVTAADIAAGTITSTQIASGTITAGNIATGTITALQIAANTITAGQIQAGTITGTEIAGTTITGSKLVANTITAAQIAANTITAAQIAAATITSSQIAANTITAGQIAAGTITATQIATGAITTNKLSVTVGGGNMLGDSSFESPTTLSNWGRGSDIALAVNSTTANSHNGGKSLAVTLNNAPTGNGWITSSVATSTAVNPGDVMTLSAWVKGPATVSLTLTFKMADTSAGANPVYLTSPSITLNGNWQRIVYTNTIAAGKTWLTFQLNTGGGVAGDIYYVDDCQVELGDVVTAWSPKPDEVLPGTIIASMIASNTITAAQIAANTITASQIAANTITAGQIAASTITATQLAANSVTASQIAAGAITANKLNITVGGGNMVPDSSFEDAVSSNSWTSQMSGTFSRVTATDAYHGTSYKRLTIGATGTIAKVYAPRINIRAGVNYTLSLWIKGAVTGTVSISAWAAGYTAATGGSILAETSGAGAINVSSTWQRVAVTFSTTNTGGGTWIAPGIRVATFTNGDVIDIDGVQLEEGDVATAYSPATQELLPGTIVANMLAADTITAAQIGANAITASELAAGAVTTAKLTAGAVTTNEIAANTITAANIAAATITGTQIAANTITAANLVANTITAGQIQAGSITGTEIAAGAITAANIAANSITAGQIASATITGTQIAATTISAANLVANTITAGQIAANTITAAQIAANTITAAQIAANTITAGQIAANTITAGQIAAGTITATQIATGTITANRLSIAVGGGNLLPDSSFESTGSIIFGAFGTTHVRSTTQRRYGANSLAVTYSSGTDPYSSYSFSGANLTPFLGQKVTYSAWVYVPSTNGAQVASTSDRAILLYDGVTSAQAAVLSLAKDTWVRVSATITVATTATSLQLRLYNIFATGPVYYDGVQIEIGDVATSYAPAVNEILPGTIVASQIATDTLTATQIAASAITSSELASGAVTTAKLVAGAVTSNEIAANTITASNIAANTITALQIAANTITAAQIQAATITTAQIAANTITASNIAAGTITATELAAGSVTTAKLVASSVTSNEIAAATIIGGDIAAGTITGSNLVANTITAGQIAAGTITATEIAAGTITGNKLVANTITASQIASATITTTQIAAGTIVGSNIAASTITGGNIAATTITAGNIAAGTITATQIATGTITANRLNILTGGGNLLPNSSFEATNPDGTSSAAAALTNWFVQNGTGAVETTIIHGAGQSLGITVTAATAYLRSNTSAGSRPRITPGDTVIASGWVYTPVSQTITLGFRTYATATDFTTLGTSSTNLVTTANTWQRIVTPARVTSTNENYVELFVQTNGGAGTVYYVDDVQVELGDVATSWGPKADEVLPGTILASNIRTNTITATQIAANTITAGQIAANTITATQIAGATITASQLAANSVTATQIASGAVTTNKLSVIIGGGNKLINSTFDGTDQAGNATFGPWAASSDNTASYATTTAQIKDGVRSLQLTSNATTPGTYTGVVQVTGINTIEPGKTYTLSYYTRAAVTGRTNTVYLQWRQADGTTTVSTFSANATSTTTGWTRVVITAVAPALATRVACYLRVFTTVANEVHYFASAQLEEGDVATAWSPLTTELGPGTILATNIRSGTITATQIAAATISSNELQANSVIAGKIAAGAVVTASMTAGTINADRLTAASITTTQLASGSVTTNILAAGSVTASKITVNWSGQNMVMNSGFEYYLNGSDGQWWVANTGSTITSTTSDAWEGARSGQIISANRLNGPALTLTPSSTGGTLVPGSYDYYSTVYNASGESTAVGPATAVIPANPLGSIAAPTLTAQPMTGGTYDAGTVRYYAVTALGDSGETAATNVANFTTPFPTVRAAATSKVAAGTATSIAATMPASAAGDLLLAVVYFSDGNGLGGTPSIATPSGWNSYGGNPTQSNTNLAIYGRVATSSEAATVTFSVSSGLTATNEGFIVHIVSIRDADTSGALSAQPYSAQGTSYNTTGLVGSTPAITNSQNRPGLAFTVAIGTNQTTYGNPSTATEILDTSQGTGTAGRSMAIATQTIQSTANVPVMTWTDQNPNSLPQEGVGIWTTFIAGTKTRSNTISWPAKTGATGYRVYRGTASDLGDGYVSIAAGTTSWIDTGAALTGGTPPATDTSLKNTGSIAASWSGVAGATGYRIYRNNRNNTPSVPSPGRLTDVSTLSYTDTGATAPVFATNPPATNGTAIPGSAGVGSTPYPVIVGRQYTLSAWVKGVGASVGRQINVVPRLLTSGSVDVTAPPTPTLVTLTNAWQYVTQTVTTTSDSVYVSAYFNSVTSTWASGDYYLVDGVQVQPGEIATPYSKRVDDVEPGTVGATQITPNSITTQQILAGGIHADRIQAATITSTQLAANSVTAAQIQAGAIDAMTITGATIQNNTSPTAGGVIVDAAGLRGYGPKLTPTTAPAVGTPSGTTGNYFTTGMQVKYCYAANSSIGMSSVSPASTAAAVTANNQIIGVAPPVVTNAVSYRMWRSVNNGVTWTAYVDLAEYRINLPLIQDWGTTLNGLETWVTTGAPFTPPVTNNATFKFLDAGTTGGSISGAVFRTSDALSRVQMAHNTGLTVSSDTGSNIFTLDRFGRMIWDTSVGFSSLSWNSGATEAQGLGVGYLRRYGQNYFYLTSGGTSSGNAGSRAEIGLISGTNNDTTASQVKLTASADTSTPSLTQDRMLLRADGKSDYAQNSQFVILWNPPTGQPASYTGYPFTVPVPGYYLFTWQISGYVTSSGISTNNLYIDGTYISAVKYTFNTTSDHRAFPASYGAIYLTAGTHTFSWGAGSGPAFYTDGGDTFSLLMQPYTP